MLCLALARLLLSMWTWGSVGEEPPLWLLESPKAENRLRVRLRDFLALLMSGLARREAMVWRREEELGED